VTRLIALTAALIASLALASCGGGGGGGAASTPPKGPPSARHASSDLGAALTGEQMRSHLLVAARLYNNAKFPFATAHVQAAQQEYGSLTGRVRSRDGALDRELHAAFPVITGQIAQRLPALAVTNRMGLVQGQLLDAGIRDAVGKPAYNDPGVSAWLMSRLASQGAREYALAAAVGGFSDRGRRAYQDAFGLIMRASSISHNITNWLGPQRNAIVNGLNNAHNAGFPTGVLVPRKLDPAAVQADVQQALAGVQKRFGFTV
jgi:hypothetical protein